MARRVVDQVVDIVKNQLNLKPDQMAEFDLNKDLGVDSLDFNEIVFELEDAFEVDLHDVPWSDSAEITPRMLGEEVQRRTPAVLKLA